MDQLFAQISESPQLFPKDPRTYIEGVLDTIFGDACKETDSVIAVKYGDDVVDVPVPSGCTVTFGSYEQIRNKVLQRYINQSKETLYIPLLDDDRPRLWDFIVRHKHDGEWEAERGNGCEVTMFGDGASGFKHRRIKEKCYTTLGTEAAEFTIKGNRDHDIQVLPALELTQYVKLHYPELLKPSKGAPKVHLRTPDGKLLCLYVPLTGQLVIGHGWQMLGDLASHRQADHEMDELKKYFIPVSGVARDGGCIIWYDTVMLAWRVDNTRLYYNRVEATEHEMLWLKPENESDPNANDPKVKRKSSRLEPNHCVVLGIALQIFFFKNKKTGGYDCNSCQMVVTPPSDLIDAATSSDDDD